MAQILIRQLDDDTKARLRQRAERHGRSMEAEARHILRQGLAVEAAATEEGLGTRIARAMAEAGLTDAEHAMLEASIEEMRRQPARVVDFEA
jgi:plasmid stability protein